MENDVPPWVTAQQQADMRELMELREKERIAREEYAQKKWREAEKIDRRRPHISPDDMRAAVRVAAQRSNCAPTVADSSTPPTFADSSTPPTVANSSKPPGAFTLLSHLENQLSDLEDRINVLVGMLAPVTRGNVREGAPPVGTEVDGTSSSLQIRVAALLQYTEQISFTVSRQIALLDIE